MCGRYGDAFDEHHFVERWGFAPALNTRRGPQMAPTDPVTVIDHHGAHAARWELLPSDAASLKEAKRASKINAPAETLTRHPRFVKAATDRVLFPATHWFEWKMHEGAKLPHVVRRKDRDYMAFAGVRETWVDPQTGESMMCAAIVTRSAYGWMTDVHDRMPLVLTVQAEQPWLDQSVAVRDLRAEMLVLDVLSDLTAFPVAPIKNALQDDAAMLDAVGPALA